MINKYQEILDEIGYKIVEFDDVKFVAVNKECVDDEFYWYLTYYKETQAFRLNCSIQEFERHNYLLISKKVVKAINKIIEYEDKNI